MFKVNRVLCALLVGAVVVGVASGAVFKIKEFTPIGAGVDENPECDGMAIFHFKAETGETKINVLIKDFLPNATYDIFVEGDGGSGHAGEITTNCDGNGHLHTTFFGDLSTHSGVIIFVDDGVNNPNDLDPDEERTCGGVSCL